MALDTKEAAESRRGEAKIFLAGSAARGGFGERSIFHDAFELD